MARTNAVPIRFRRDLHWPIRQRCSSRPIQTSTVPIERASPVGVPAWRAAAIAAFVLGIGAGLGVLLPALVRWSIPL